MLAVLLLIHAFSTLNPIDPFLRDVGSPPPLSPTQTLKYLYSLPGARFETKVDLFLSSSTVVVVFRNVLSASYSI